MSTLIDPKRTVAELKELRALTGDEFGAQRVAFTPMWVKTRAWLAGKLAGLPVETHTDEAGNFWATLHGESERELIINHANWTVRGGVERNARVVDVSDAGDWSAVRVSYGSGMGTRVNPTFGFIYPGVGERIETPVFTPTHRLAPLGVEIAMLAQAEMDSGR